MVYLTLLFGLALLVAGAEGFVRGASAIAQKLGVSPLLIGITLVGFGTSAPELVISIQAALNNSPGLVMGNIVGTNTANILLILGLGAVLAPIPVHRGVLKRDGGMLIVSALACLTIVLLGFLDRIAGLIFLALLGFYLVRTYQADKQAMKATPPPIQTRLQRGPLSNIWIAGLLAIVGLAVILVGARFFVDAAIELARTFGVSETLIGLTIVAVGTSSPEVAITIISAIKKQADLALGNIIGSNIFNVLGILGITALVQPITMPPELIRGDIWVMLAATALMLVAAWTGRTIMRWEGWLFLASYGAYIAWLILTA